MMRRSSCTSWIQLLFFARAVKKQPSRAGFPRKLMSIMLACSASEADSVVYGDGLDRARGVVPLGTVCRLCLRTGCGHRREAPPLA